MEPDSALVVRPRPISPSSPAPQPRSGPVLILTLLTFAALLAGQFGFSRLGLQNPLIIPERLAAAIILTVIALPVALSQRKQIHPPRVPMWRAVAPLAYLVLTATWGFHQEDDMHTVLADLASMIMYCILITLLLYGNTLQVQLTLMWCMTISGLAFSIAGLANAGVGSRVAAFGGGPNVYGRITFLGVVGIVGLVANRRLGTWALIGVPVMLAATLASGSRGAMVAAAIGSLALVGQLWTVGRGRFILALVVVASATSIAYRYLAPLLAPIVQQRVIQLTFEQRYTSGRGPLIESALTLYREHLFFGAGLRSFAQYYGYGFTYPHNLLAQVAAEGGTVGFLLLLPFLGLIFLSGWRNRADSYVRTFAVGALAIFTASMFSGDYYDARFLWIFGIVSIASIPPFNRAAILSPAAAPPRGALSLQSDSDPNPARLEGGSGDASDP